MGSTMIHRLPGKLTATIANGTALSGVINLAGAVLVTIQMPSAWTAAALTFQGSHDGLTFGDVYDDAGTELSVSSAAAAVNRVIIASTILDKLAGLTYLKIRSGTTGTPVNQGADRVITLVTKG
jgi:hypothetical protein